MANALLKHTRQNSDISLRLIPSPALERSLLLDVTRGIAIVSMIFYHIVFDLINVFQVPDFVGHYFWVWGPDLIGGTFLAVSGVASVLSNEMRFKKILKRGGKLFGIAMALTLGTVLLTHQYIIFFGILHCIGASIVLGHFFIRRSPLTLSVIGLSLLISGYCLEYVNFYSYSSHWLQMNFLNNRVMLDFFSLYPYFGYYLLGMAIAKKTRSAFNKKNEQDFLANSKIKIFYSLLAKLGRNSLWIYLIHQPVILGVFYVFFKVL